MVALILCGFPCSGKSTVAKKLLEHYGTTKKVLLISENEIDDKNYAYNDRKRELKLRSILKSKIHNAISSYDIVIIDAMNHIKSLRYEIYCICKEQSTNQVLLVTGCSKEQSVLYNNKRPKEEKYKDEIIDLICGCFEIPETKNRWDSPMIVIEDIFNINYDNIDKAIINKNKKLKPNDSTKPIIQIGENYLNQVDQITQVLKKVIKIKKIIENNK